VKGLFTFHATSRRRSSGKSASVRSPASVFVAFALPSGSSERSTLILFPARSMSPH
jgi:hypothetical protein